MKILMCFFQETAHAIIVYYCISTVALGELCYNDHGV